MAEISFPLAPLALAPLALPSIHRGTPEFSRVCSPVPPEVCP